MLEARAAAGRAAPVARVEAERAGGVAALQGHRRFGEQLADLIEGADVACRVRARGLADRRLVDEDHIADLVRAAQRAIGAGRLGGLAEMARQGRMEHVLDQRRLARARDPRDADQPLQRNLDRDVAQVVLARAFEHEARCRVGDGAGLPVGRIGHAMAAGQVGAGQRVGRADGGRRAVEDDGAAALAGAGAHVDQAVGGEHDRGVVFDHDQRVAGVAQALHRLDDAVQVARVQADAGFVEHEQRVDQRGAQCRGQVDALDFATRQRTALPVQRQVADADVAQVSQARAHLGQQQLECVVEQGGGQRQLVEETADARDRQQHEVVHRQAGQGFQLLAAPGYAARQEALRGRQHRIGVALGAQAPQHGLGLQPRAAAGLAGRIAAVLGQQHADVHLVRLRLQVVEEAPHAVPLLVPAAALPAGLTVDDPVALRLGQLGPRRVARNVVARGVAHQVVLAFLPGRGLHRLDGAFAQGFARVGDHQPEIDADHAAEPAARLARTVRRVEGEEGGLRIGVAQVAFGAVQAGGEAPDVGLALIGQHVDVDAAAAALERRFDRLQRTHALGALQAEPVGHYVEQLALAGGRFDHAFGLHPRVAADGQPLRHFVGGGAGGQFHGEGHHQAGIGLARAREQFRVDRLRRVVAHRQRGLPVEQLRGAGEQQLEVVVELGHRADRRARAAHRVGLVDRDGRRHALDAVDLGAVHAVEKLARVGAEGLDVAALAFGVERVEDQAGLARPGRTGDHGHFAGTQVEVEVLEVVLTGSAQANDTGRHGRVPWKRWKRRRAAGAGLRAGGWKFEP